MNTVGMLCISQNMCESGFGFGHPEPNHSQCTPSAASQLHPSGGWRKQEEKILESLLQLPKGNELP